jgi:Mg-chelatase subunit ChlD
MKSKIKKRIVAFVLCMVLVLTNTIFTLAGDVSGTDLSELEAVPEAAPEAAPEDAVMALSEGTEEIPEAAQTPQSTEVPVVTEPVAEEAPQLPAEQVQQPTEETPAAEDKTEVKTEQPVETDTEVPEEPETPDSSDTAETPDKVQEAMELTHQFKDADGNVVATIKANIPEETFDADTSEVTMDVKETDADTTEAIKALIEKPLAEDKVLGEYFLYDIQFKVNGQVTEPGKAVTISIERANFKIEDTQKVTTFYYNEANSVEGNTEPQIKEIIQRADLIKALQDAQQSTDDIEDYDITDISLNADGTLKKLQTEGRRSTIYGCYIEEDAVCELNYENSEVTVKVTAGEAGIIPEDAVLQVTPILPDDSTTKAQYQEVEEQLQKKAENEEYDIAGFLAYDISLVDAAGNKVEPNGNVRVFMDYKQEAIPEGVDTDDDADLDVTVMHLEENTRGDIREVVDMVADTTKEAAVETTDAAKVTKAEFVTDSFSYYTITWTRKSFNGRQVKIYYIDSEGKEITVPSVDNNSSVEIDRNDVSEITLAGSDYQLNIEGYTYQWATAATTAANAISADKITKIQRTDKGSGGKIQYQKPDSSTWSDMNSNNVYMIYEKTNTGGGTGDGTITEPEPSLSKTAIQTDPQNNKYQLNLDISSSVGSITNKAKLDVLFIIDRSGSMGNNSKMTSAKDAAKALVTTLDGKKDTIDTQYALVSFAGSSSNTSLNYGATIDTSFTKSITTITTAIDGLSAYGATNYDAAFQKANTVLTGSATRSDASQVVIFLTDGQPTIYVNGDGSGGSTSNADVSHAWASLKALGENTGIEYFYSIGVGSDFTNTNSDGYKIINALTNGGQYNTTDCQTGVKAATKDVYTASETDQNALKTIFENIAAHVTNIACKNVAVTDTLSDYVTTSDQTTYQFQIIRKAASESAQDVVVYESEAENWGTEQTISSLSGNTNYNATTDASLKLGDLAGINFAFDEKKVTCTYPAAYELSQGYTYKIVINEVGVSGRATEYFAENKAYPSKADAETGTFAGKLGFYSNVNEEAKMTYTVEGEAKKANFPKPVVQLSEEEYYENSVVADKSAKVANWDDRTYDITLNASSVAKAIENEEPVDIVLVFDRSGSMHFRSGLKYACEGTVTDVGTVTGLETNQVYYYVSNDSAAVVYRFWYYGGSWRYIDDSYWKYSSDPNNGNATSSPGAGNEIGNGGKLNMNYGTTYTFYKASGEHDRLHYLKAAANTFAEQLATISPDSRIGLVTFAQQAQTVLDLQDVSDGYSNFVSAVNGITTESYTYQAGGLTEAQALLNRSGNSGRKQYVILLTDGCPTIGTYTDMENAAATIKNTTTANRTVMTVAVGLAENNASLAEAKRYLSICASAQSGTNTKYAYSADDADTLPGVFQSILQSINNVAITNATVKDYIDPRFEVDLDSVRAAGGTVGTDANGTYVIWTEQTLNPEVNGTPGWSKTIRVQAKNDYIGGNDVTTNGAASGVTVGNTTVPFEQPTVNVKATLEVKPYEVTIYKGDSVPTTTSSGGSTTIQSQMASIEKWLTGGYAGVSADNFGFKWYSDADCTTEVDIATVTTDADTTYYLKVTYNAGSPTNESNSNTTTSDGTPHHAGNDNNIVEATNAYKVNVISGAIQITKKLQQAAVSDQTFNFVVEKKNADGTYTTVKTVSINVPAGTAAGVEVGLTEADLASLTGLERGEYRVSESILDGYRLLNASIGDATNTENLISTEKAASFKLGYKKDATDKDVISNTYQYASTDGGTLGVAVFTNAKVNNWQILKKSSSDSETPLYLSGARFTMTADTLKDTDGNALVYTGVSSSTGVVEWKLGDQQISSSDLEADTYTVKETEAPTGYAISTEEWKITISYKGAKPVVKSGDTTIESSPLAENGIYTYIFENTPVYKLPNSGGMGIFWYSIGGVLLMLAAALILYKTRCREVLKR